jgi:hypothetical protein
VNSVAGWLSSSAGHTGSSTPSTVVLADSRLAHLARAIRWIVSI